MKGAGLQRLGPGAAAGQIGHDGQNGFDFGGGFGGCRGHLRVLHHRRMRIRAQAPRPMAAQARPKSRLSGRAEDMVAPDDSSATVSHQSKVCNRLVANFVCNLMYHGFSTVNFPQDSLPRTLRVRFETACAFISASPGLVIAHSNVFIIPALVL